MPASDSIYLVLVATADKQYTTEKILGLVSGKKITRGILKCEHEHDSLVILIFETYF